MSDLYILRNTLRTLARPGKMTAALLLILLAVSFAAAGRFSAKPGAFDPASLYNLISAWIVFGFILLILSAVFATGLIVEEMEQKTIPYLLTRPIPRWRILLSKYVAAVIGTTLTVWVADLAVALTLFSPAQLGHSRLMQDFALLPVGALTYCSLFLLMATLLPRPLIFALAYSFVVEFLVQFLPGEWKKVSLMAYLHTLAPHLDNGSTRLIDQALAPDIPLWAAWAVLLVVLFGGLIGSLMLFSVREYTPREETT